jgi:hypothetical protein
VKKLEFDHEKGFCTQEQGREIDELLKEKNIEFESHMVWAVINGSGKVGIINRAAYSNDPLIHWSSKDRPAYSSAELGFLLPHKVKSGYRNEDIFLHSAKGGNCYFIGYRPNDKLGFTHSDKHEAQAKADLLIQGLSEDWINDENIGT